jgi:hypothetical protein
MKPEDGRQVRDKLVVEAVVGLRQAPIGAAAAQREAHHGIGREVIVEARGTANGAGRQIMAAPVPAPNETAAALSVPGAAAGSPGTEPMFKVPVEPA